MCSHDVHNNSINALYNLGYIAISPVNVVEIANNTYIKCILYIVFDYLSHK